jgi:hypothetical protein
LEDGVAELKPTKDEIDSAMKIIREFPSAVVVLNQARRAGLSVPKIEEDLAERVALATRLLRLGFEADKNSLSLLDLAKSGRMEQFLDSPSPRSRAPKRGSR